MRRHATVRLYFVALAIVIAWSGSAFAQSTEPLTIEPGTCEQLIPLVAHEARCLAISDTHQMAAFGHDRTWTEASLTLYRLDAQGQPQFPATGWKLPCPEPLQKAGCYAAGVVFHPRLPLLYVWNDVGVHFTNPPTTETEDVRQFDRLLIYDLSQQPPTLVVSLCRGIQYLYGQQGGALAIDAAGEHLYIPNLRDPKNAGSWHFGRFALDADGLPKVLTDAETALPRGERGEKLRAWNQSPAAKPSQTTPYEYVYIFPGNFYGSVGNIQALSPQRIIAGGPTGAICWRPDDPHVTLSGLPIRKHHMTFVAAHPSLPVVYATKHGGDGVFRIVFHEGYWTGVPRGWSLADVKLTTPPVLMGKDRLAVAGAHHVFLLALDDRGQVQSPATAVRVFAPNARTLAFSEKFGKLYVGVDLSR
jgi:hypothetical protein